MHHLGASSSSSIDMTAERKRIHQPPESALQSDTRTIINDLKHNERMKQLIACCGLDCEQCEARIATLNDDNNLRKKVAKEWGEMNQMEFQPEWINCMGCRTEGCKTYYCSDLCKIRHCVMEKGYNTCGECAELRTCSILGELAKNAPGVFDNLKSE